MTLFRIVAPHYVAGLIARDGRVVEAAPILGWTVGKSLAYVLSYFDKKRFSYQRLD